LGRDLQKVFEGSGFESERNIENVVPGMVSGLENPAGLDASVRFFARVILQLHDHGQSGPPICQIDERLNCVNLRHF
jgi:hypothetical protein